MGLCFSCGKSKERFKDKKKICGHIQSTVAPLRVSHENNANNLNGHLPCHSHANNSTGTQSLAVASMSTSFSKNINITNPIKGLVSKRRNRYKQDGYDLDLTYITDKIVAMGYPASKIESVYRNHIDDVAKMLDSKHQNHYFIYNLCSERCYDTTKFHNRVKSFPFDDHNPPMMELIQPFCHNVDEWLAQSEDNIAVVHCKAGKGRTGTMICCYLLHSGKFSSADQALTYYGQKRTQDRKGVTIPSQMRYVRYYAKLLNEGLEYKPVPMYIKEIVLKPAPTFVGGQGCVYFAISQQVLKEGEQLPDDQNRGKLYKSEMFEIKKGAPNLVITLNVCLVLRGDVKLEFYTKRLGRKEKILQFWFNTFFVVHSYDTRNNSLDENSYELTLWKDELDILNKKDKQNKMFSADFQLSLSLQKIDKNESSWSSYNRQIPRIPQDTTPSESSEAESSEADSGEEGWESGEYAALVPPPPVQQ